MPIRHDWTREEIRRIYELPFPELMFQAQSYASRISPAGGSATVPFAFDQDRRLPRRLRLLFAERPL